MKRKFHAKYAAAGLMACIVLLAGCSGGSGETADSGKADSGTGGSQTEQGESLLSFVAADKTNWDKEVNIGEYAYTLAVDFNEDGSLELAAVCTGRAQAETGRPGGQPGGEEETEPAEEKPELTDSEKSEQDFSRSGSWEYEEGYGYTVTIDGYTTKTNYDEASARQVFYAEISNGSDTSGLVQFQGKDTQFRNEKASDYEDFEVRDAEYIFMDIDTSTNNNPNSTKLYLEKDGSANSLTYRGSEPTYTRGTWNQNDDKTLTVSLDGTDYTADYCDISGKEGYRIHYNSSTMYTSVSGEELSYTEEDFNGRTVASLSCAEQDYTIELTEKGFACLYKEGALESTGKYTVSGDNYAVILNGETFESEGSAVTVEMPQNQQMPFFGGQEQEPTIRTFQLEGTLPAGNQDSGSTSAGDGGTEKK